MTATQTATHSQQAPQRRAPLTALLGLLTLIAAAAIFAGAYLVSHHSAPKAPAAKVVAAKITPGPDAKTLSKDFNTKIGGLIKPVVHKKAKPKPKPASTSSSDDASSSESSTPAYVPPASTYTPPAVTPTPAPSTTHKSKAPSGGGVITIG